MEGRAPPHPRSCVHTHRTPLSPPSEFWHSATRLDTNSGRKKRGRVENIKTGSLEWHEHWRHVQYCTDVEMCEEFFKSVAYGEYLASGGRPFKDKMCALP